MNRRKMTIPHVRLLMAVVLLTTVAGCVATSKPFELTPEEGLTLLKEEGSAVILDVRGATEFRKLHLEDALNINFMGADFDSRIAELDREAVYLLYCKSGTRSGNAAEQMRAMGFERAWNIGGIDELRESGYPVIEGG